ncbi:MAG: tetraacyldisaccharide 4'-kinase, partial [Nitrospirae bacterium]
MSVLDVLTVPYELAVRTRHWFYRHGWLATRGLPCPVMSVGNVTVGGTGKTPFVIWLARQLQARGHRLGVLSRGYRRTSQAACLLVSDGREVLVEPQEAGDEPFLIAQRCPGVLVAVGTNRYEVGKWVLDRYPVDAFLLDDGFQHVALARDIDLVL